MVTAKRKRARATGKITPFGSVEDVHKPIRVSSHFGDSEIARREAEARCRARDESAAITRAAFRRSQMTQEEDRELARATVKRARYHVEAALKALELVLIETNIEEHLATCVKALRGIANGAYSDPRARGMAKAALKKLGVRS